MHMELVPASATRELLSKKLEIRRQSVDFPVAVAGRFEAAPAIDFLGLIGRMAVAFGAARRRLGERALRFRREYALFRGLSGCRIRG